MVDFSWNILCIWGYYAYGFSDFIIWLEKQQKFDFFLYSCVVIFSSQVLVNSD